MANQSPRRVDAARMAKRVEQLVKQTPPEVIQRMNERLQERRKTPAEGMFDQLVHKRAGQT